MVSSDVMNFPPKKNLKLSACATKSLIFAPLHPSRAPRGEGRIPLKLFLKYTAQKEIIVGRETVCHKWYRGFPCLRQIPSKGGQPPLAEN